jgi:hypothetical protein
MTWKEEKSWNQASILFTNLMKGDGGTNSWSWILKEEDLMRWWDGKRRREPMERREGREKCVLQPRERKKIRNGIFLVPLPNKYLFPCNYLFAPSSSVLKATLILFP